MKKNKRSIPKEEVLNSLEEFGTPRPVEEEDSDPTEKPLDEGLLKA